MNIRPFTPEDYPALAALSDASYVDAHGQPVLPTTADEIAEHDAETKPPALLARWVVEEDGKIIAAYEYSQASYRYHPQKFWIDLYIDPAYQRRGLGRELYQRLLDALAPLQPTLLRQAVREDMQRAVDFLHKNGWTEAMRTWESFLDLRTLDLSPYRNVEADLQARTGITITTQAALANDPDRDRKLYDLIWEVRQDVPDLDPPTRESFEDFTRQWINNPDIPPESYFVAVDGSTYVGMSYYRLNHGDPTMLRTGLSGIARSYRRQGVAFALKIRGLQHAQAKGYTTLRTTNESNNRVILGINERMGFVKRPAWIDFVYTFDGAR